MTGAVPELVKTTDFDPLAPTFTLPMATLEALAVRVEEVPAATASVTGMDIGEFETPEAVSMMCPL